MHGSGEVDSHDGFPCVPHYGKRFLPSVEMVIRLQGDRASQPSEKLPFLIFKYKGTLKMGASLP